MAKHSTLVRTLVGIVLLIMLVLTAWGTLHRVRGGAELPPPKWSEADLVPLPSDAENAWGVIGPLGEMPDFAIDLALWDDSVPIQQDDIAAIDAELARPARSATSGSGLTPDACSTNARGSSGPGARGRDASLGSRLSGRSLRLPATKIERDDGARSQPRYELGDLHAVPCGAAAEVSGEDE